MTIIDVEEALRQGKAARERYGNLEYVRFTDDFHASPKGSVVLEGRWIQGYGHIGRIFRLEQGLRQQFSAPFWVEEKVDGYNVRVLWHRGQLLALTRGGYVCPFSTDRIPEFIDLRIFKDHPDLILCAEVAGPDNPYACCSPPYVKDDVQAFVFDMIRSGGTEFLEQREKMRLSARYRLPTPEMFGRYEAAQWREISVIMERLDREGREGIVLKEDSTRNRRTKYVTSHSGIYDIGVRASDLVELTGDFFTGRILRLVLFMDEQGATPDDELYRRLGGAFLDGLFESVARFKDEGQVYHRFRCRFRKRTSAENFMTHIRRILGHSHAVQRKLNQQGGYWVLEFDKEVPKLTGLLRQLFRGESVVD